MKCKLRGPVIPSNFLRLLENFLNLSDIRSDRKIFHVRPGNFLSDKFLFCVEHLKFLYRTFGLTRFWFLSDIWVFWHFWPDCKAIPAYGLIISKTDKIGTFQEHCFLSENPRVFILCGLRHIGNNSQFQWSAFCSPHFSHFECAQFVSDDRFWNLKSIIQWSEFLAKIKRQLIIAQLSAIIVQ